MPLASTSDMASLTPSARQPLPSTRARRLILGEAAAITAMSVLTRGVFMVGYALALGATPFQIALLSSTQAAGSFTQLFANQLVEWFGSRKTVCLLASTISRSTRPLLVALPWITLNIIAENRMWWFLAFYTIASGVGSLSATIRTAWWADLVPEGIRGRFFGKRNLIVDLVGMVLTLVGGKFLDLWGDLVGGDEMSGFQILFAAGTVCGALSLYLFTRIPEPPLVPDSAERSFREKFRLPFENQQFRRFMAFSSWWSFAMQFAAPFWVVYMVRDLGMDYGTVTLLTTLGTFASLYCVRFWGRLADHFGNKPVLLLMVIGKAIFPILWIFATPGSVIYLAFVHAMRAFNSGQTLTQFNLVLKLAPDENRAQYLATRVAARNLTHALGGIAAGVIAAATEDLWLPTALFPIRGLHVLFAISGLLRLCAIPLVVRVEEPDAKSAGTLIRVVRQVEGVSPTDGFDSFIHFWFAPIIDATHTALDGTRALKDAILDNSETIGTSAQPTTAQRSRDGPDHRTPQVPEERAHRHRRQR